MKKTINWLPYNGDREMIIKTLIVFIVLFVSCTPSNNELTYNETTKSEVNFALQDSIIKEHLENGAWKQGLYSNEWQEEIDRGLAKDSTIAYLWQQKAMPLFKQGKYELGMKYLDQAVKFDPKDEWQEYRAFMKCIFAKTYREAIIDFEACKSRKGNSYVMDHSFDFYIALSKIQLNEYAEAEKLLAWEVERQLAAQGEEWVHHLDLFYLAIAKYEQKKYADAIVVFDKTLKLDPLFAEALYYKANCVGRLGDKEEATKLIEEAKKIGKRGNTINEDNAIYERYPYQVRWELWE